MFVNCEDGISTLNGIKRIKKVINVFFLLLDFALKVKRISQEITPNPKTIHPILEKLSKQAKLQTKKVTAENIFVFTSLDNAKSHAERCAAKAIQTPGVFCPCKRKDPHIINGF